MENRDYLVILYDYYGELLNDDNRKYFEDYYFDNLSLAEIAENNGITRQAVRDNIKKGENKLFEYEEKLRIMNKTLLQEKKIAVILSEITEIKRQSSDKEVAKILEHIKAELNCLV